MKAEGVEFKSRKCVKEGVIKKSVTKRQSTFPLVHQCARRPFNKINLLAIRYTITKLAGSDLFC